MAFGVDLLLVLQLLAVVKLRHRPTRLDPAWGRILGIEWIDDETRESRALPRVPLARAREGEKEEGDHRLKHHRAE